MTTTTDSPILLPRTAEWVLAGHPDRLADAIAEAIVDEALALDPDALAGVEVAVHRGAVFVDGRVAAGDEGEAGAIPIEELVRDVFVRAGYGGEWCPDPASLGVAADLVLDALSPAERAIRCLSDDQSITVGHALGDESTGFLPVEQHLARTLARRLDAVRRENASVLGPDGKVLVRLEPDAGKLRLAGVSISIHHAAEADRVEVTRLAFRAVETLLVGEAGTAGVRLPARLADLPINVNGAGAFAVGGPLGDNGLSGKKLALDFYGPHVPLGGGALHGKDPHKVDRLGAIRARQIARHLVEAGLAREATVHLVWEPGERAPASAWIALDGRPMDPARARRWLAGYDMTIEGTVRDLGLTGIRWRDLVPWGLWGHPDLPWERWAPGQTMPQPAGARIIDAVDRRQGGRT